MCIWPEMGARIAAVPSKGHDPTRAECGDHTQNQDLKYVLELARELLVARWNSVAHRKSNLVFESIDRWEGGRLDGGEDCAIKIDCRTRNVSLWRSY